MKKNQYGFGIVELVLIVLVLGLLGFGAYTLYAKDSEDSLERGKDATEQAETLREDNSGRNDALERATELDDSL